MRTVCKKFIGKYTQEYHMSESKDSRNRQRTDLNSAPVTFEASEDSRRKFRSGMVLQIMAISWYPLTGYWLCTALGKRTQRSMRQHSLAQGTSWFSHQHPPGHWVPHITTSTWPILVNTNIRETRSSFAFGYKQTTRLNSSCSPRSILTSLCWQILAFLWKPLNGT